MPYNPTKPYKQRIQEAIQKTWNTPYAKAFTLNGCPYPFIQRLFSTHSVAEVDHTDGIGTKGVLHAQHHTYSAAVQDALAMNLNDLLVVRARPYKLQNHITIQSDDHNAIVALVSHLCHEAKMREIIVTGGETSIHNTMQGLDVSLTVTGYVEGPAYMGNELKLGDVLIGLPSTGLHSNGFTFVREHFGALWNRRELTAPTKIYWDDVWPILNSEHGSSIHGMVHIAGGGFSRLLDYIPDYHQVRISRWATRPQVFDEIYRMREGKPIDERFMYSAFNCGMGMILSVPPEKAEELATLLKGEIIGYVAGGGESRLVIQSIFSGNDIEFE